jgi:hypothetical protein
VVDGSIPSRPTINKNPVYRGFYVGRIDLCLKIGIIASEVLSMEEKPRPFVPWEWKIAFLLLGLLFIKVLFFSDTD